MTIFTADTIRKALSCIKAASREKLDYVDHELQDDSNSLIIMYDYIGVPTDQDLDNLSSSIKGALDPWMPKFGGSPSWTINIYHKRTLIHCIVGDGKW